MVAKANAKDEKKPPKADEKKDESSSEKGGKDGSGSQKGGKKGKGGDGKGDGKGDDKAVGKKSNLKQPSEKKDDGELKKLGDRPIIYMDTGDQLDADQVHNRSTISIAPIEVLTQCLLSSLPPCTNTTPKQKRPNGSKSPPASSTRPAVASTLPSCETSWATAKWRFLAMVKLHHLTRIVAIVFLD